MQLLHYKALSEDIRPNGPTLIVQHGLFGLLDNWMTLGRQWAVHYPTYLLDARNHGRSFHDDTMNYEAMAEDVYNLITTLDLPRPVLIGHSMGGKAMMQFAADYPTLWEKLVVIDIAPRYYAPHHQTVLAGLNAVDLAAAPTRAQVEQTIVAHGNDLGTAQFLAKSLYRDEGGQLAWRFNLPVLTRQIEQVGRALDFAKPITKPVLFVRGSQSRYIQPADEAEIHRIFPQAQVRTIAGAGHWVHAEQPQALYGLITEFIHPETATAP
ncbi:MAG: alpha/beta fold hydrolase [Bernardetiaceae bacterium]|nr:alpha/beta fold hydrolase [Bernardetiaceae bacterium]